MNINFYNFVIVLLFTGIFYVKILFAGISILWDFTGIFILLFLLLLPYYATLASYTILDKVSIVVVIIVDNTVVLTIVSLKYTVPVEYSA